MAWITSARCHERSTSPEPSQYAQHSRAARNVDPAPDLGRREYAANTLGAALGIGRCDRHVLQTELLERGDDVADSGVAHFIDVEHVDVGYFGEICGLVLNQPGFINSLNWASFSRHSCCTQA